MKYIIIMEHSPVNLSAEVNKLIKKGWQPLGGICFGRPQVEKDKKENTLFQAMVKYTE